MTRTIAAGTQNGTACVEQVSLHAYVHTCAHTDILIQNPVSKKCWNAARVVHNNKLILIILGKISLSISIANHDYKNVPRFRFSPALVETGLQLNCTNTVWWALNAVASFHRSRIRFSYPLTKDSSDQGSIAGGPHSQSWLGLWWTAHRCGMVTVGGVRRGEVAWTWPTAPPPSSLHQQSCVATLKPLPPPQHLTFYCSQISKHWEI